MDKVFTVQNRFLNLQVTEHGKKCEITLLSRGEILHRFRARLAENSADFCVAVDLSRFMGSEITVEVGGYMGNDPYEKMELSDRRTGYERMYKEELRPRFHFSPICGWLNDPNGLLYYRGTWFMFAQLNPYYRWVDNMHWLLAVSTDLFHWEDKGLVLHAGNKYQKFSGSGIVDEHNVTGLKNGEDDPIILFYTDAGPDFRQCMAYSTDGGKSFKDYEHNPILQEIAPLNRDPKVIPGPDGKGYLMALYLSGNDYALFESTNLVNWEKTCVLNMPGCLECPDIYEMYLDGDSNKPKMVFSCAGGQYLVGKIDNGQFISETEIQYTYCAPFYTVYAPQTFYGAPDNRRIQVICSSNETQLPGEAFGKFITVPCELTLRSVEGGMKLFSSPVKELRNLECNLITENTSVSLENTEVIPTPQSNLFRIEFSLPSDYMGELKLNIFNVSVPYSGSSNSVEYLSNRFYVNPTGDSVKFDIVVDRCSAEIFVNDGEIYLPVIVPFDWDCTPFALSSDSAVNISSIRVVELENLLPWSKV